MRCEDVVSRLDELLDNELAAPEAQAAKAHLEQCVACMGKLEETRELLVRAADLPGSIQPPRDLWPSVEARIAATNDSAARTENADPSGPGAMPSHPRFAGQGRKLTWATVLGMAAAAIMGIALILGYTIGRGGPAQTTAQHEDSALSSVARSTISDLGSGDLGFTKARQELMIALEQRRDSLSPQTMTVVQDGLRTIDESIDGIAAALEKNPGDPQLVRLMASARRQEIDLLRRAAQIPGEI